MHTQNRRTSKMIYVCSKEMCAYMQTTGSWRLFNNSLLKDFLFFHNCDKFLDVATRPGPGYLEVV